jgi:hypothetical protein
MLYPWPSDADAVLLDAALEIAMGYLEYSGQAEPYTEVRRVAAHGILTAWSKGARHVIRLGNAGIVAVEHKSGDKGKLQSSYPRVS